MLTRWFAKLEEPVTDDDLEIRVVRPQSVRRFPPVYAPGFWKGAIEGRRAGRTLGDSVMVAPAKGWSPIPERQVRQQDEASKARDDAMLGDGTPENPGALATILAAAESGADVTMLPEYQRWLGYTPKEHAAR